MIDVAKFKADGFVLIPELVPPAHVEEMVAHMERMSGWRRDAVDEDAAGKRSKGRRSAQGWTVPDGVTKNKEFWPLIFNERLHEIVRELLESDDIRFLQHTDLHVGFSSFNWHRDSVSRDFGNGADWDESEPYKVVRVGHYLQPREATGGFRLGLIPGTHRPPEPGTEKERRRIEKSSGAASLLKRYLTGKVPEPPNTVWVQPAAGDVVIFDPRVIHTGTPVDGAKYSAFVAFGAPNKHSRDQAAYYRYLRPELGYDDIPAGLTEGLEAAGLHMEVEEPTDGIPGATIPSAAQSLLARAVRPGGRR